MLLRLYFPLNTLAAGAGLLLALEACTQNPPVPKPEPNVAVVPEPMNAIARPFSAYDSLYWSDEFDNASLDSKNWAPEIRDVWFNNELQATTNSRNNLAVAGGNLTITAQREAYNGRNYTSARIASKGLREFTFGRVDVRAKLPKGKGIWPAIWMLGANDSQVSWPACGEIDIMELKGSTPRLNISTIHFGASVATHQYQSGTYTLSNGDFSTDFHTFSVVRSLDTMRFFVDGNQHFMRTRSQVSPYPFNEPFYAILNLAVGGDFDGDPDASTTFPQQMLVDYVRYYKYKE
jgi:beta-glucanase (GH16 family)